jgi:EmrB/QacA subfamily drug resistance transporter
MNQGSVNKTLVLLLCCLAQFMVVMDIAIVNVALPTIQSEFDMSQSGIQWVVIAYGLLLGGFLLLGGRVGDLLGRRRILLAGLALFTLASLVAGIANSAETLIAARGFQGFGAALLAPAALSILASTFREGNDRNSALGIYGAVGGSSASIGVIASGLLTDGPGWRWIFFINVPVGLVLLAMTWLYLEDDRGASGRRHYDTGGAITVTAGLLLVIYALNRGAEHGWTTVSTLGMFAASVLLLIAFVAIERRTVAPLVPGSIFRNRTMVASDIASFLLFGSFIAFIFLGSLLMQQLLSYSPTRTGVAWLATSLLAFVAAAVAGAKLVPKFGIRPLLLVGAFLLVLSAILLARIPGGAAYFADIFPAFVLAGMAVGLCGPSLSIGALAGSDEATLGLASGLVETMREIGGVVGIAAVSTVLIARTDDIATISDPAARAAVLLDGFQNAYIVISAIAAIGIVAALVGFPASPRTSHALPDTAFAPSTATPESAD